MGATRQRCRCQDVTLRLVVIGAGRHAIDVLECIEAMNATEEDAIEVVALLADSPSTEREGGRLASRSPGVLGRVSDLDRVGADAYVIAVGYPLGRRTVLDQIQNAQCRAATLVHPAVTQSFGCEIGPGSIVLGPTRLSPFVSIGNHALVSYHVALGHGCRVNDLASVMPGAIVGGEVTIGRESLVGSGAVILEDLRVGDGAIVGAGAVVTTDVRPGATVVGVPARPVG
jgi:sugar O-acyltransferase (sialic acid O-acetyltransferase NeuD family)